MSGSIRMKGLIVLLICVVALPTLVSAHRCCPGCAEQPAFIVPEPADQSLEKLLSGFDLSLLLRHVQYLASDNLEGRKMGTPGEDLAGYYISQVLKQYRMEPWADGGFASYEQQFSHKVLAGQELKGENIIAHWPGQNPDQFLIIGAHYDHEGVKEGKVYNGADDNAVGVATVLELARCFAKSGLRPKRTVVFALFSGQEEELLGSRNFVKHLGQQKLLTSTIYLNLDLMGGSSGDYVQVNDLAMREDPSELAALVKAAIEQGGITASLAGPDDSDALAFAEVEIPAISLNFAPDPKHHPYFHKPEDDYDKLNQEVVKVSAQSAFRAAWLMANR